MKNQEQIRLEKNVFIMIILCLKHRNSDVSIPDWIWILFSCQILNLVFVFILIGLKSSDGLETN